MQPGEEERAAPLFFEPGLGPHLFRHGGVWLLIRHSREEATPNVPKRDIFMIWAIGSKETAQGLLREAQDYSRGLLAKRPMAFLSDGRERRGERLRGLRALIREESAEESGSLLPDRISEMQADVDPPVAVERCVELRCLVRGDEEDTTLKAASQRNGGAADLSDGSAPQVSMDQRKHFLFARARL